MKLIPALLALAIPAVAATAAAPAFAWTVFSGLTCDHTVVDPHNSDSPYHIVLKFQCDGSGVCKYNRDIGDQGDSFTYATHTPTGEPGHYTVAWGDDSDTNQDGTSECADMSCTVHYHLVGSGSDTIYSTTYTLTSPISIHESGNDPQQPGFDYTCQR